MRNSPEIQALLFPFPGANKKQTKSKNAFKVRHPLAFSSVTAAVVPTFYNLGHRSDHFPLVGRDHPVNPNF